MATVRVVNRTRNQVLAETALVADRFWSRCKGLLGRSHLAPGHGLVLLPAQAVHSLGMRFSIDVLHLDRAGRVLHIVAPLAPGRCGPFVRGSRTVVELPAGTVAPSGTAVGDQIDLIAAAP